MGQGSIPSSELWCLTPVPSALSPRPRRALLHGCILGMVVHRGAARGGRGVWGVRYFSIPSSTEPVTKALLNGSLSGL